MASDEEIISNGPKLVTVSRDALRADLNSLELRLHTWMTLALDKKANDTDFEVLRQEIRVTADAVTTTREAAAKQLSEALSKAGEMGEARFSKIENAQSRLFGGLVLSGFLAPSMTGLFVYFVTKGGK